MCNNPRRMLWLIFTYFSFFNNNCVIYHLVLWIFVKSLWNFFVAFKFSPLIDIKYCKNMPSYNSGSINSCLNDTILNNSFVNNVTQYLQQSHTSRYHTEIWNMIALISSCVSYIVGIIAWNSIRPSNKN